MMVTIPASRMEAARFASYVEELQEFARSYKMRLGSPDDLRSLRDALRAPGPFREECASMMRSIVYRQRGKAPAEELLALVATAWGGATVNEAEASLKEPLGEILRFLAGVMSIARDSPPDRPSYEIEVVEPAESYADVPLRVPGMFAAAQTMAAVRPDVPVAPFAIPDEEQIKHTHPLETTLKELEAESPDVQLYLQLLKQREEKQETTQPAVEAHATPVVLDERPVERAGEVATLELSAPVAREDPWDKNSELQRELRQFAVERQERATAYQAAKAALSPHLKLLFAVEDVLFRLVGSNNFVRRYLARRVVLPGGGV